MTHLPIPRRVIPDVAALPHIFSAPPDAIGYAPAVLPIKGSSHGRVLADACWFQRTTPREPTALMISSHSDTQLDMDVRNAAFVCGPNTHHIKWNARLYSITGEWIGVVVRNADLEHLLYFSMGPGDFLLDNCSFENGAANGLQQRLALVDDGSPPEHNPYWNVAKVLTVRRSNFLECGQKRGGGRAAFTLSPKSLGPTSSFICDDVFVQTVHQTDVDSKGHNSFGGMCLEQMAMAVITGGAMEMDTPANGLIQAYAYTKPSETQRHPNEFVLHDWTGIGGRVNVRVDRTNKIDIRDCKGDATIQLWHADIPNDKFVTYGKPIPIGQGYSQ